MVFAIHWHESAMDLHVFPILIPPNDSLISSNVFWGSKFPPLSHECFVMIGLLESGSYEVGILHLVSRSSYYLFSSPSFFSCHWFIDSVQFSSVAQSCLTLFNPVNCSTPGLPVHHHLPEFTQNPCPLSQWCHPTISSSVVPFSSCPQSFPASGFFSNESALHIRWPKCWSFSFSIIPFNEYSGLISFRMDWLISLQSKGLSRVFFNTTVQKHQFFGAQLFL